MHQLNSLSSLYLKALLNSFKDGFDETVGKFGLVRSEFREIYDRLGGMLVNKDFREEIIGILLYRGESPEDIAELIEWRDFEYLVFRFLEARGFRVFRGVRVPRSRYEVDLVAIGGPLDSCLVVECKRWSRIPSPSQLRRIVDALVMKATALKSLYTDKCSRMVPMVVTLRKGKQVYVEYVPIIPINFLRNFLGELTGLILDGGVRVI